VLVYPVTFNSAFLMHVCCAILTKYEYEFTQPY